MGEITEDAIGRIVELSRFSRRTPLLRADDGSKRAFLYNDKTFQYEPIDRVVVRSGAVCNVESFIALVIEEARRRENKTGHMMTVTFSETGASFEPDEAVALDAFAFKRKLSPQFALLASNSGKPFAHADFVRLLQKLRPSITDYPTVSRAFRKVSFDSRTAVTSNPILERGEAGSQLSISVAGKSDGAAGGNVKLPSEISMRMQYSKGSEKEYSFKVEVDAALVPVKEVPTLVFSLIFVDQESIAEEAVDEELARFKKETGELSDLLVLANY